MQTAYDTAIGEIFLEFSALKGDSERLYPGLPIIEVQEVIIKYHSRLLIILH